MKKEMTYNAAFAELEKLVEQVESDQIPLDSLAEKVKKAKELISICEAKLRTIEKAINSAINP